MKIPLKKISILTFCSIICFTFLRILQLLFCVEPVSGFFKTGYKTIGTEISIAIFLFTVICFVYSFFEKKAPVEFPKKNISMSIAFLGIAIFLIADLYFFPLSFTSPVWQTAVFYAFGIISIFLLIFAGLEGLAERGPFKNTKIRSIKMKPGYSIAFLIFWIIRTIMFFSFYTEIAVISDLVFEIFGFVSVLILLLYMVFFVNDVEPVKTRRRILPLFVFSMLSLSCSGLPQIILFVTGNSEKLHNFGINTITFFGILIFLVVVYFNLFKANNLKPKTKKHLKDKSKHWF